MKLVPEVLEAFKCAGEFSKKITNEEIIVKTRKVGIIPEALNFNGYSGLWDIDYELDNQLVVWTIKLRGD